LSSKYATVKIGDYTIPLIGVLKDATLEKCDSCGVSVHITEIKMLDAKMLCAACLMGNNQTNE
jgi:formylmethanofuran dehydrogenase subunit E